jgi:uncharacterized membrane protein
MGMAGVLREWDMVMSGLLLLLMQLVGINLAGAAVLRTLSVRRPYARGRPGMTWLATAASAAALAGRLLWQFTNRPAYQRSSKSERALDEMKRVVNETGGRLARRG